MDRIVYEFFGRRRSSSRINAASFVSLQHSGKHSSPRANPMDAFHKFRKLLAMQLGQIPNTETEKDSKIWRSMRLIKHDIYTNGITSSRGDTKVLLECWKYFTSERSEPTTALKHISLVFTSPTKIYCVTMVTLIFSYAWRR